jgi:tetratricopeptide (TPR) repeat protein
MVKYLLALSLTGMLAAGGWWWYSTTRPDYRLRVGLEALDRGDPDTAELMAARLAAGGYNNHALLLRGKKLLLEGRHARALEELNRIRDTGWIRLEAAVLSGRCQLKLKNPHDAERAFLFVLKQDPNSVDAHRGLAAVYFDQGAMARAVLHCEKWAELSPTDGRPYRFMGHIYQEMGQKEDALSALQKALQRDLAETVVQEVLVELADLQVGQSQYEGALQTLSRCDAETAKAALPLTLRAECLFALGKKAQARDLVRQALEAHPGFARLLRLRARQHLEAKEYRAAAALLEKAVRADPNDLAARALLAQAYTGLGRPADAREQQRLIKRTQGYYDELTRLTRQLLVRPTDPGLHRRMADLYQLLNKPELAAQSRRLADAHAAAPSPVPEPKH